jgi:hypothetical protein
MRTSLQCIDKKQVMEEIEIEGNKNIILSGASRNLIAGGAVEEHCPEEDAERVVVSKGRDFRGC